MFRTRLAAASCLAVLVAVRGAAATYDELYQPMIIESVDGMLDVTLNIAMGSSLDGTRSSPMYNGQPMGPTIKVKPGDLLTITLNNQLPPSSTEEKAMMTTVKDPEADVAEVTKLYNRLQDDGNVYGPTKPPPPVPTCSKSIRPKADVLFRPLSLPFF